MEVIVFESEAFYRLQQDLLTRMAKEVKKAKEEALDKADPARDWLSTDEAKKLLGIKSKTRLQQLRDMDEIRYSKSGRIIRYSKKSILEYLDRYVPTYRY